MFDNVRKFKENVLDLIQQYSPHFRATYLKLSLRNIYVTVL